MSDHWSRVSLMVCPICTRSFRPDAYERHQKVRSGGKEGSRDRKEGGTLGMTS
jgi:hypothetical protein